MAGSGLAAVYLLPRAGAMTIPLSRLAVGSPVTVNAARPTTAFVVLAVPAMAMGATFPVLTGALGASERRFGQVLGRLYAANTLGAVAGILASEIWLVARVGVLGTAWTAASLDLVAGAVALAIARHAPLALEPSSAEPKRPKRGPRRGSAGHAGIAGDVPAPRWLPGTALACGLVLMGLDVVWFRFLSMYVLTTTLAVSIMLVVVLTSIAVGSAATSAALARGAGSGPLLPWTAAVAAAATVVNAGFGVLTSGAQVGDWRQVLWFAVALCAPTAACSGAMFTLIADRFKRSVESATRTAAVVTAANTAGALAGPPIAAFLLLPWLVGAWSWSLVHVRAHQVLQD